MTRLTADKVIAELGITEPQEIDLEAIAWHLGAEVKYCELDGCEACILGHNDRAIIRVSSKVRLQRQRFSIGHELGHWCHHRNRPLFCKTVDIGNHGATSLPIPKKPEEKSADAYASDLLMPRNMFSGIARQTRDLNFKLVKEMAGLFKTSLTATAIRLVDLDHSPSMLVAHGKNGKKWFRRSASVPERWFPQQHLDRQSPAFDVMFGDLAETRGLQRIGADAWFDRRDANRYQIFEQTIKGVDETLTLLIFRDSDMLRDEDKRGWSR